MNSKLMEMLELIQKKYQGKMSAEINKAMGELLKLSKAEPPELPKTRHEIWCTEINKLMGELDKLLDDKFVAGITGKEKVDGIECSFESTETFLATKGIGLRAVEIHPVVVEYNSITLMNRNARVAVIFNGVLENVEITTEDIGCGKLMAVALEQGKKLGYTYISAVKYSDLNKNGVPKCLITASAVKLKNKPEERKDV